jgi:hypothetical protein
MSNDFEWPEFFHPAPPLINYLRVRADPFGGGSIRMELADHDNQVVCAKLTLRKAAELVVELEKALLRAGETRDASVEFDTSFYLEALNNLKQSGHSS